MRGKQLKESGPVMLNSQVGVVPLDTKRFAPVGCLQQVKFQHKRGVQGSLQEGVIAEHRHTHNGGVHHRVLGESARSNRALPSLPLCLADAETSQVSCSDISGGRGYARLQHGAGKRGTEQHQGQESNPCHCRQTWQLPEGTEQSPASPSPLVLVGAKGRRMYLTLRRSTW